MEADAAISALEAYARGKVRQEAVVARRAVVRLRKKGMPPAQLPQKELEDLRSQVRRLEVEVARLNV